MNKLKFASSPYLLQHKDNPVFWNEWSSDILADAKSENKLIIISIGYAACHWCHVMEHETFNNEFAANKMNSNFISIKIDREERPDIDNIYMEAAHLLTGSGGWPLNVFALPDGRPFFAGTYFQKEQRLSIIDQISNIWKNEPVKCIEQAELLTQGI